MSNTFKNSSTSCCVVKWEKLILIDDDDRFLSLVSAYTSFDGVFRGQQEINYMVISISK